MELRAPLRREAPGRAARPQHRCAGSGGRRRRRLPPGALTPEPPGPRSRLLPPPPPGSLLTFRKTPDVTGSPRVSPPPRRWRRRRRHPRLSREARRGRGGRQTARGEPDRGGRLSGTAPRPELALVPGVVHLALQTPPGIERTTSYAAGSRNSSLVDVFSGCASLGVATLSAGFALSRRVNKHLEKAYTGAPEPLTLPVAPSTVGAELVRAEQPRCGALSSPGSAELPLGCAGRGCPACCALPQPPPPTSLLLQP
ncbi:serine/arginine repetitive matrix protein 1-like [Motacilla alba alba]|uniref:serine/arginine repetitive matrix protein 1-like n=1 Tax=Motacilla alba alba TaxID=1094192 RepID=UPI0018D573D0|nr:serine/arginine repetitive matrix protein 1-like [Motacilla alba alba]